MSKKSTFFLFLAFFALMLFPACASDHDCARCERIDRTGDGWCETCHHGAVHGEEIDCAGCYMVKTGHAHVCKDCSR